MFRFQIKSKAGEGQVKIHSDGAELRGEIEVSGGRRFVNWFKSWLSNVSGPFGLPVGLERVRPNDLDFALSQALGVYYSLEEGELSEYTSPPPGSCS